ncbi:diguanylate cyclase [Niveibacterium sp. 24ML]|uniref:diguanylate cyclase n=1 Tax=Niveibacterium sp. 24ML TaxID=2985512 RepID=UPI0022722944|nr:diguanylate cyclase [Niveibacterium sp. 24ML]MCX9158240.1 diguanylate cyclase [Niveibacterium sp. 24ML]
MPRYRPLLRLLCWFAFALTALGLAPASLAQAPDGYARIHFQRSDGRYEGWGLHVWGDGHALGSDVLWTDPLKPTGTTDYGIYFDIPLQEGATVINFIVHRGSEKSVATDQLLPLDEFNREVWVRAGDEKLYAQPPATPPVKAAIAVAKQAADRQPAGVWVGLALVLAVIAMGVIAALRTNRLREDIGRQTGLLAEARAEIARQAAAQNEAQAQNRSLAGVDELTGVLTRNGFRQAMVATQAKARRNRAGFAVFFVDLDNFKPVNDRFGHGAGDHVLKTVAGRFVAAVRESDTVARLGGDEFIVIADELSDPLAAARLAQKLVACATEVVEYEGNLIRVAASIGIAVYPHDGADDALVASADAAMYRAKNAGKNCVRFVADEFDELVAQQDSAEAALREALDADRLDAVADEFLAPDGAVWARRVRPVATVPGESPVALTELVSPDAALALASDTRVLERLAALAEAAKGGVWAFAPARASLGDPRFIAACRGVLARLDVVGAQLVLEFDAAMVRPEGLNELIARGLRFGLAANDPARLRVDTLLMDALSYIRLPNGDGLVARASSAAAAAAARLGVAVVLTLGADETASSDFAADACLRLG